jgi:SAM-dependent methyltransferase
MSESLLEKWREQLRARVEAFDADGEIDVSGMRPLPPAEHIRRVNSAEKAEPRVFLRSGASDLLAIVDTLVEVVESRTHSATERPTQSAGLSFPARPAVMELGCGVGRLLRHAPPPTLARIVATDVNAESLDWCRANLPDVEYHHHDSLPPIASLPAMAFDIIYAHSVFTHIPLERQLAWLREVERLLRPGGWLAATFLGSAQQDALLDAAQRDRLSAEGAIQIFPEPAPGTSGGGPPTAYGAVCQTIAHQEAAIGSVFDLCARRQRHGRQDVLVVRRR